MGWENKESSGTILDFGELIKSQKLHMRKTDSQDEWPLHRLYCDMLPLSSEQENGCCGNQNHQIMVLKTRTSKSLYWFDCACMRLVENGGD